MTKILNRFTQKIMFEDETLTLKELVEKNKTELKDADLTGGDLQHADLTRADLAHADLTCANLARADLAGANLYCANLTGGDLSRAILARANLYCADLTGANLAGANLTGANLAGANLNYALLANAHLAGANLADANLAGANLNYAFLTNANLRGADLTRADLARANLPHNLTQKNKKINLKNIKISKNNKKLLIVFFSLLAVLSALFVFDLIKNKTRFNKLKNDEIIELETQVKNLQNKVEQMENQLVFNADAIKQASLEINLCRAKCKSCTYHLSANYEN